MIATQSPIARLGVQVASPVAVLVAVFLFFAGHNRPGGGFAAGLVLGAVLALRSVAGLSTRTGARPFLAFGAVIVALVAVAPLFGGATLLDQVVIERDLPALGKVKGGSSLLFDAGVTLVVIGLVGAVLDGLGARDLVEEARAEEATT